MQLALRVYLILIHILASFLHQPRRGGQDQNASGILGADLQIETPSWQRERSFSRCPSMPRGPSSSVEGRYLTRPCRPSDVSLFPTIPTRPYLNLFALPFLVLLLPFRNLVGLRLMIASNADAFLTCRFHKNLLLNPRNWSRGGCRVSIKTRPMQTS